MTTTVRRRMPEEPIHKKPLPKTRQASQRAVDRLAQRNGNGKPVTDDVAFSEEYTVTYVAIDQLHRHPKNRTASDAFVAELAESIREHGLQQPIKVRVAPQHWGLPEGHYQIVFGESRWRAARLAGLETMPAHVVEFDDVKTLELIVENAAREQLNPIQKAEQIATLCAPVEEGGGGKTREQAAQLLKLKTGAAASNLARLLELPKVWRDRVAGAELPESFARLLLPYKHVPQLMDAFDKDYLEEQKTPPDQRWHEAWSNRERLSTSRPTTTRGTFPV
jgi:ParB/RepB/Spo0J family partition protein